MLKNYIKVAFRNLIKNKVTSAVNIVGLATGMTAAVLIFLWVHNEQSYDGFYAHASQLYKLWNRRAASITPRKFLVIFQFVVAIVLMTATLVMYQQNRHVRQRDNGYDKSNLVECRIIGDIEKNYELIKNDLLTSGSAVSVCRTGLPITMDNGSDNGFQWAIWIPIKKIEGDRDKKSIRSQRNENDRLANE
jgi:hypothetical protein